MWCWYLLKINNPHPCGWDANSFLYVDSYNRLFSFTLPHLYLWSSELSGCSRPFAWLWRSGLEEVIVWLGKRTNKTDCFFKHRILPPSSRIHQQYPCRGVRSLPRPVSVLVMSLNCIWWWRSCPGVCGIWSTLSLPLLPGSLLSGLTAPVTFPFMSQIELSNPLLRIIIINFKLYSYVQIICIT